MTYTLFIDDERYPVDTSCVMARSSQEAIAIVKSNGVPSEILFDHDLGGNDTSMIFIDWLINAALDGEVSVPESFTFSVHSQNPIGKQNIESKMNAFIAFLHEDNKN